VATVLTLFVDRSIFLILFELASSTRAYDASDEMTISAGELKEARDPVASVPPITPDVLPAIKEETGAEPPRVNFLILALP